ncbi:MAG: ubiquinol-cytochrome c reductase iron-sulfur subunit [Burkholderiales bacterium RIFCSPLOWO2_12_67_14]|nr:MAG: ubiquinol-cytochrome c reductase iron-sulfur subunit [Burkholderiales bacterium RIFCSPLOWO2_02_FULL_67_64]OGB50333.1 MAG: ubiquinol-cytochrome c reductase iron-sulfur subunit [Burkholderiales bacterium RIFCSPLOWO2_12_67_14]OGB91302.1 MAG: ubiquinol-cytochrome c reductase iron-sulfur subunit [Burkholderiales bacterium RIFCSPLOWO2_12_FULL_67_210]
MSTHTFPSLAPDAAEHDAERRTWLRLATSLGGVATVGVAVPFVANFAPSERAKAQGAPVEVDISDVAPGGLKTVEWRGKPVWILRRTPDMLAALEQTADLADPASEREQQPPYAANNVRSVKPEVLVVVGICTHLGCSPTNQPASSDNPSLPAGWKGGFFCPCHGSTFDYAGRVFRNKPAPSNLEVPPYRFLADNRLLIGEDGQA